MTYFIFIYILNSSKYNGSTAYLPSSRFAQGMYPSKSITSYSTSSAINNTPLLLFLYRTYVLFCSLLYHDYRIKSQLQLIHFVSYFDKRKTTTIITVA